MSSAVVGSQTWSLASRTVLLLGVLAVPCALLGAAAAGAAGAVGALIGVGFVFVLFGASALLLHWSIDRRPGVALGALLGGALGRIVLYAAALGALSTAPWVHPPSLAWATGAAVTITLAAELRWLSRLPRLFWVDAEVCRPTAVSHATRSSSL